MLEVRISELPLKTSKLEVNDLIEVSEFDSTFGTYTSKHVASDKLLPSGAFVSYNALLTQVGLVAPTEIQVGVPTISPTLTWTRLLPGLYNAYCPAAFPLGQTMIFIQSTMFNASISAFRVDDDNIMIQTKDLLTGASIDNLLDATPIKIEVYL